MRISGKNQVEDYRGSRHYRWKGRWIWMAEEKAAEMQGYWDIIRIDVAERRDNGDKYIYVILWIRQSMGKAEDMQDNEDNGSRYVGVQDQAHWTGNHQWCTTLRNNNDNLYPYPSPSKERSKKEVSPPRRIGFRIGGDGNYVLPGRTDSQSWRRHQYLAPLNKEKRGVVANIEGVKWREYKW